MTPDLITRLEKAESGSRELLDNSLSHAVMWFCFGDDVEQWPTSIRWNPASSVDAAVALKEMVLPGWFWRAGHGSERPGWAHLNRLQASHCNREDEATGWAATPALALCIAILRALKGANNG